tara:strand:- start:6151 stop:8622 length:2472 start_codon:yes stop_codon:yes gene_type:complete
MSVRTEHVDVYNGDTGWNRGHVMDALEEVFEKLGWNSGTQEDGVPVACIAPGQTTADALPFTDTTVNYPNNSTEWTKCGGAAVTEVTSTTKYYYLTDDGTSYLFAPEAVPNNQWVDTSNDTINCTSPIPFETGDAVVYAPTGGVGTSVFPDLTENATYYVIKIDALNMKLAANPTDASAGTAIDLTTSVYVGNSNKRFRGVAVANPTITVNVGDTFNIIFGTSAGAGTFNFLNTIGGSDYAANRVLNADNCSIVANSQNKNGLPYGDGTEASSFQWATAWWNQTEDEQPHPNRTDIGYQGLHSYGYASDTVATMKGTVIINPSPTSVSSYQNYYKYTVSGATADANPNNSGTGRTDLKLRIHRPVYSTNERQVSAITIQNKAVNWQNGDEFTIPGDQIGGATPANDITFGTNQAEQTTNGYDGTPSIVVTSLGAGSNMYQKHPDGRFGILRLENDTRSATQNAVTKDFGITYWGFSMSDQLDRIRINCGPDWNYVNRLGTNATGDIGSAGGNSQLGYFHGDVGLDIQNGSNYCYTSNNTSTTHFDQYWIAYSSSTTNYPLRINFYAAQAPDDDNFVVIQFTQLVNQRYIPWWTFTLHKGLNFGANVWDLDHVWNGTMTNYRTSNIDNSNSTTHSDYVYTSYITPDYSYTYGDNTSQEEPVVTSSRAREASYGYTRNQDDEIDYKTYYKCNIDCTSSDNPHIQTYFRDSDFDKINRPWTDQYNWFLGDRETVLATDTDYYRPIKGLPITNRFAPCPYYMPDSFVMIQAAVQPGKTHFRPGDIVEISTSEKYTVIVADQTFDQQGLDSISGNTSRGMLFCARRAI